MVLNCVINTNSHFDRKHYFYPDLPKGYQISQYKEPLCGRGCLELNSGYCVDIERVHLEEDTAKSFHADGKTLIDFNKSGIALIEIVTAPCFGQVADAVEFCKKVQDIARVCDVSDADMEKGNKQGFCLRIRWKSKTLIHLGLWKKPCCLNLTAKPSYLTLAKRPNRKIAAGTKKSKALLVKELKRKPTITATFLIRIFRHCILVQSILLSSSRACQSFLTS